MSKKKKQKRFEIKLYLDIDLESQNHGAAVFYVKEVDSHHAKEEM